MITYVPSGPWLPFQSQRIAAFGRDRITGKLRTHVSGHFSKVSAWQWKLGSWNRPRCWWQVRRHFAYSFYTVCRKTTPGKRRRFKNAVHLHHFDRLTVERGLAISSSNQLRNSWGPHFTTGLPRCSQSLLNRFRTGQGTCKASMYK